MNVGQLIKQELETLLTDAENSPIGGQLKMYIDAEITRVEEEMKAYVDQVITNAFKTPAINVGATGNAPVVQNG